MIRLYLLPAVLAAGALTLVLGLSLIAGGVQLDLFSGVMVFAVAVLPISAIGLLGLMPIVEALRQRPWSITGKASAVSIAGMLFGAALLAWLSLILGALCGLLSAGVWLSLNWRHLQPRSVSTTL
jgi:hypothetical protein